MENNNESPVIPPEQQAPVVPSAPVYEYSDNRPDDDANKKLGTTLCIISLICKFGMPLIGGFITGITSSGDIGGIDEAIAAFVSLLTGAGSIAAWVLVIVARVKCKDTFSKVLLIVYLVLLGLEIIAVILFIVACAYLVNSCNF